MQHVEQVIRAGVHKSLIGIYQKWNLFKLPGEGQPTLRNTGSSIQQQDENPLLLMHLNPANCLHLFWWKGKSRSK